VKAFHNDGSLEDFPDDVLLASEGSCGVIVRKGHLLAPALGLVLRAGLRPSKFVPGELVKQDPDRTVFLVRFEDAEGNLGIPIGCWAEELRAEEL
jgi:nitrogen fixation protein NifZ